MDAKTKRRRNIITNHFFECCLSEFEPHCLNSTSKRFPNGFGNDNGLLGKYMAFHNYRGNLNASIEGFEDKYYFGRRPTAVMMPNFRNVYKQETDFQRGYMVHYSATRSGWDRGFGAEASGRNIKMHYWNPAAG